MSKLPYGRGRQLEIVNLGLEHAEIRKRNLRSTANGDVYLDSFDGGPGSIWTMAPFKGGREDEFALTDDWGRRLFLRSHEEPKVGMGGYWDGNYWDQCLCLEGKINGTRILCRSTNLVLVGRENGLDVYPLGKQKYPDQNWQLRGLFPSNMYRLRVSEFNFTYAEGPDQLFDGTAEFYFLLTAYDSNGRAWTGKTGSYNQVLKQIPAFTFPKQAWDVGRPPFDLHFDVELPPGKYTLVIMMWEEDNGRQAILDQLGQWATEIGRITQGNPTNASARVAGAGGGLVILGGILSSFSDDYCGMFTVDVDLQGSEAVYKAVPRAEHAPDDLQDDMIWHSSGFQVRDITVDCLLDG